MRQRREARLPAKKSVRIIQRISPEPGNHLIIKRQMTVEN
jgi:hypothetical protein